MFVHFFIHAKTRRREVEMNHHPQMDAETFMCDIDRRRGVIFY